MAHIGTAYDTHSTTSRGGGGAHNTFGLLAISLAAAVSLAALTLPALGLAVLSAGLLVAGFGLAIAAWWRPAPANADGARGADIAALLVLLGFIGALIGDTEALFH